MSKLVLAEQASAPSAPGSGKVAIYVDANGDLAWRDAAGNITKIAAAGSYTLTLNSSGALALGGFTLTVPATGIAALRDVANTFTQQQNINAPVLLNGAAYSAASGAGQISVSTSPVAIANFQTNAAVMLSLVWGTDGAASFADLILTYNYWGTVVVSTRVVSSPSARTYTTAGGQLLLAFAGGTWGVRCHVISNLLTS